MNASDPKMAQPTRLSRGRSALSAAVAALTLAAAGGASAATVLNVGWGSQCGTSTCFDSHGTYTVTFSAATFHGPVDISKLLLSRSVLGDQDGHFFSLNFQLNGHQVGSWGNWNVSGLGGDQLSIGGSDLIWNPADGDLVLVMDLVAANGEKLRPDGHGGWYVPAGGGGSAAAPLAPDDEPGGQGDGFGDGSGDGSFIFDPPGDTPTIDGGQASGAPEPATWAMMLGGFGLAGWALRRRAKAATA